MPHGQDFIVTATIFASSDQAAAAELRAKRVLTLPNLGSAERGLPAFERTSTDKPDTDAFQVSLVVHTADAASAQAQAIPHLEIWLQTFGLGSLPYEIAVSKPAGQ
jgi:hypothetical protein